MKANFLKIAGVKSEQEFYKKYPTEAAFFKAHPEAKKQLNKAQVGDTIKAREVETIPSGYSFYKKDESGRELYRMAEEKKKAATPSTTKKPSTVGKGKAPAPATKKSVVKMEDIVYMTPKKPAAPKETAPEFDKSSYTSEVIRLDGHTVGTMYYPTSTTTNVKSEGNVKTPNADGIFRSRDDWNPFTGIQFTIESGKIQDLLGATNTIQDRELFQKYIDKAKSASKLQLGGNIGSYIGGESETFKPLSFKEIRDEQDFLVTGMTDDMRKEEAYRQQMLQAEQQQATKAGGNAIGNILSSFGKSGNATGTLSKTAASSQDKAALSALSGKKGAKIKKGQSGLESFAGNMGGAGGIASAVGDIAQGIQLIKQQKEALKSAKQSTAVSDIALEAASTRPEMVARRYARPEDMLTGPGEAFMSYGTGTNFLQAEYGAAIGGNPTEIQNMYNPGTLYSDLGYEPLEDSDRVKQYRRGGYLPMAQGGFDLSSFAKQGGGDMLSQAAGLIPGVGQDAGSRIGKGAGNLIGTAVGGPIGGMIGSTLGTIAGGLIDRSAEKMEKEQKKQQQNINKMAMQQGAQAIQGQYSSFVRNGGDIPMGEYGWVSHDWQPQVITKFGEYDVKDLLKPDPTMDALRTGGNIRQNYMNPEEQMAFGGEMKTHWGGYAEPISQNPYLPGTGETVMFRGQSHDESDGKGRTGIGVSYGPTGNDDYTDYAEYGTETAEQKADVEVERGEPAIELPDTGDSNISKFATGGQKTSMVVYGNLMVPKQSISEIGDSSLSHSKPVKFKSLIKKYSEKEEKANNKIDKATESLNNITPVTSLDKLALNTQNIIISGENEKLKTLAQYKMNAAALQQAINKTAEEMGVDADSLAKGKIKAAKPNDMARNGKEIELAQKGKKQKKQTPKFSPMKPPKEELLLELPGTPKLAPLPKELTTEEKIELAKQQGLYPFKQEENPYQKLSPEQQKKYDIDVYNALAESKDPKAAKYKSWLLNKYPGADVSEQKEKEGVYDYLKSLSSQLTPLLNRPFQEALDPNQILGELTSLGNNPLEPVQAQTFQPLLATAQSEFSLQDQLNANQADFNALQRMLGYNPAALSQLAAQKYAANSKVLADQFRMNQQMKNEVFNKNRELLNDAQLKNLAILDQQYTRQEQAKSNTKATFQEAMNSIAAKTLQNKAENRELAVYSNMFPQYGFDPNMRTRSRGLTLFDTNMKKVQSPDGNITYEKIEEPSKTKHGGKVKKHSTNASILKMYKS